MGNCHILTYVVGQRVKEWWVQALLFVVVNRRVRLSLSFPRDIQNKKPSWSFESGAQGLAQGTDTDLRLISIHVALNALSASEEREAELVSHPQGQHICQRSVEEARPQR